LNRPYDVPPSADDEALKGALRGALSDQPAADTDALAQRVLAQWADAHAQAAAPALPVVAGAGRSAVLGAALWRRKLWLGMASLAVVVLVGTAVLLLRPDPALEELMQPDVLSQMAIGEM